MSLHLCLSHLHTITLNKADISIFIQPVRLRYTSYGTDSVLTYSIAVGLKVNLQTAISAHTRSLFISGHSTIYLAK